MQSLRAFLDQRSLFTAAAVLTLPGCGLVDSVFQTPDWARQQAEPARQSEPLPPLPTNQFVLANGDDVVGAIQIVNATHHDTFVEIARNYGLGFDEIKDANPDVDPWLPGEGTPIVLPTRYVLPEAPRQGIVLNVATKRLFYYPPRIDGEPQTVETYPIGIGRDGWATPTGETTVTSKGRDPVWYVPASIRREHAEAGDPLPPQVPPGPDNPLGSHVIVLGLPGYLIHGTNKPAGVGMRVSHGCVRLFPEDIEHLFEQIPIGTEVRIVNQPFLLGWQAGDLLLEAHPPLVEDERDWLGSLEPRARASLVDSLEAAPEQVPELDAERITVIAGGQRGFPVSVLDGGWDTAKTLRNARWVENVIIHEQVADIISP
ncbi:MAG: L,D-transpeptidase family protein [Gammaproteobacteria bacterium]|nr:L,D-transpeptidase family protein [Gammaproteobacteria bacterium]